MTRMTLNRRFAYILAAVVMTATSALAEEVVVGAFSSASPGGAFPSGWSVANLARVDPTRFRMVDIDGVTVVQMDASNAAGTLYRPIRIDPHKTPTLRWRWRVRELVEGGDLYEKRGDDSAARLYVMFDYPLEKLSWIDRGKILLARSVAGDILPAAALCYLWDSKLTEETQLWNAYSDRVRVIVAEGGARRLGQWVSEERNVAADFRAAFGEEAPPISGIAIAADTDQTGETVRAWIGDISFSGL